MIWDPPDGTIPTLGFTKIFFSREWRLSWNSNFTGVSPLFRSTVVRYTEHPMGQGGKFSFRVRKLARGRNSSTFP